MYVCVSVDFYAANGRILYTQLPDLTTWRAHFYQKPKLYTGSKVKVQIISRNWQSRNQISTEQHHHLHASYYDLIHGPREKHTKLLLKIMRTSPFNVAGHYIKIVPSFRARKGGVPLLFYITMINFTHMYIGGVQKDIHTSKLCLN
jgi:hypothetical protein